MPLRLNGSGSGYVELAAPAVAGTTSLVLPTDSIQPGLVLLNGGNTTFSGQTSLIFSNILTSTYDDYLVRFSGTMSGAGRPVMRLRSGTIDATTGYDGYLIDLDTVISQATATAQYFLSSISQVAGRYTVEWWLSSPAKAEATHCFLRGLSSTPNARTGYQRHTTAAAYDGLNIYVDGSGNFSGTVSIFGVRK